MQELIHKLGIEPKLLIAQIINFSILLLLLYKFLYKPVLSILQKRENYIKHSLHEAQEVEKRSKEFETWKTDEMKKAKEETNAILEKAIVESEKIKNETVEKAKLRTDELMDKAEKELVAQKEQMLLEARKEIGNLVILATQEVSGKIITTEDEKRLIEETVENLGKKDKREMYTRV